MKKIIALMTLCVLWIFGTSFAVAGNMYMNGNLGAVWLTDSDISQSDGTKGTAEYDTGFGITGALGYDFGMFRVEGEVGYRKNDYDKVGASGQPKVNTGGDVSNWDLMVNGYLDIKTETPFTPYVGLGIGGAFLDSSAVNAGGITIRSDNDSVFAYQAIAGVAYTFAEVWMAQLEYRFFGTTDPTYGGTESEYKAHNLFIGIRYNF